MSRLSFWRRIIFRPVWLVVVAISGLLTAWSTVQAQFFPESWQDNLPRALDVISDRPWYVWAIVGLLVLLLITLEGAYRVVGRLDIRVKLRGFWGYDQLEPGAYVWIIHSVTLTNRRSRKINLEAVLRVAEHEILVANDPPDYFVNRKPPDPMEQALCTPINISGETSCQGCLVFIMRSTDYAALDHTARSQLLQSDNSLLLRDLVSGSEEAVPLPLASQVVYPEPVRMEADVPPPRLIRRQPTLGQRLATLSRWFFEG